MNHQSRYFGQKKNPGGGHFLRKTTGALLHRWMGVAKLERMYANLPRCNGPTEFITHAFKLFNIEERYRLEELDYIPQCGASVVLANHPFGAIEGMALIKLLLQRRADVRVLGNNWLQRITELADVIFPVNPYGGGNAIEENRRSMRLALQWLKNGGLLLVFPAGEVAHLHLRERRITDPEWHLNVARLIKKTQACVVPVYFFGRNSLFFHLAGMLHPRLRTMMLPRELLNKKNMHINYAVGKPICDAQYNTMNPKELMDYLRMRTYMLAKIRSAREELPAADRMEARYEEPIMEAVDEALLGAEVRYLRKQNRCLTHSNQLSVFYADAGEIPHLLREIGRLREITFRDNGEGVGRALDLDEYDRHYTHLFAWDDQKQCVVGGYRIGLADRLIEHFGMQGLYTHSLFKYSKGFIQKMQPALELGRSFIRKEYQRAYSPLLLLWRGIAQFVLLNPQYKTLFGPVSISNEYNPISQQLLVEFLKFYNFQPDLARSIKARNPLKKDLSLHPREVASIKCLDNVSEIISLIEKKNVGVPILIKQYLKLGGVMLGFNIDKSFGNSIDCLVKINLIETDPKILEKYFGEKGVKSIHNFHSAA